MKNSFKDATIKQCIDLALEKANTAVKYDTSNDFHNAIAAYTEAVELLVFVLQHPSSSNDTVGLKSICNIYLERIDFLSYLKMSEENNNDKQNIPQQHDPNVTIPSSETSPLDVDTSTPSSSSSSHSQQHHTSKLNTVLMNIFAKKSTKKKKTSSATSFGSNHTNIFNFTHHQQKDAHKSVEVQPRASKSSPVFPLDHSKWNKQARTRNHHLSSDNILSHQYHGQSLPYTATPHHLQHTPANTQQRDNDNNLIPNVESRSDAAFEHESYPQKQYNTTSMMGHGSHCGHPAADVPVQIENSFPSPKSTLNTALPIPKKSSQRKKRASPPPLGYSEPIRDSSLNATSAWRSTNRSPFSSSQNFSDQCRVNMIRNSPPPPPPISDKSANRASASLSNVPNKRVSSLRLKTTFSLTNPPTIKSGGTIISSCSEDAYYNNNNEDGSTITLSPCSSIPNSPIKTVKIDPNIILNYPEAQVTVSNENIMNTFGSNMAEPTVI